MRVADSVVFPAGWGGGVDFVGRGDGVREVADEEGAEGGAAGCD